VARDYAKGSRSGARKKPQAAPRAPGSPWRWYGAGVATGMFLSPLLYLGT